MRSVVCVFSIFIHRTTKSQRDIEKNVKSGSGIKEKFTIDMKGVREARHKDNSNDIMVWLCKEGRGRDERDKEIS